MVSPKSLCVLWLFGCPCVLKMICFDISAIVGCESRVDYSSMINGCWCPVVFSIVLLKSCFPMTSAPDEMMSAFRTTSFVRRYGLAYVCVVSSSNWYSYWVSCWYDEGSKLEMSEFEMVVNTPPLNHANTYFGAWSFRVCQPAIVQDPAGSQEVCGINGGLSVWMGISGHFIRWRIRWNASQSWTR